MSNLLNNKKANNNILSMMNKAPAKANKMMLPL